MRNPRSCENSTWEKPVSSIIYVPLCFLKANGSSILGLRLPARPLWHFPSYSTCCLLPLSKREQAQTIGCHHMHLISGGNHSSQKASASSPLSPCSAPRGFPKRHGTEVHRGLFCPGPQQRKRKTIYSGANGALWRLWEFHRAGGAPSRCSGLPATGFKTHGTHSLHRNCFYIRPLSKEWESELSCLIHVHKHRESNKMKSAFASSNQP